jgi:hypothetical protein
LEDFRRIGSIKNNKESFPEAVSGNIVVGSHGSLLRKAFDKIRPSQLLQKTN